MKNRSNINNFFNLFNLFLKGYLGMSYYFVGLIIGSEIWLWCYIINWERSLKKSSWQEVSSIGQINILWTITSFNDHFFIY